MAYFTYALYGWITIAFVTLILLLALKIKAPYGRHTSRQWGPVIDNRLGWFIMELPALIVFPMLVILGPAEKTGLTWFLLALWIIHYFNRTIVFPFRLRTKGKKMPLIIVCSAIFFNVINGLFNGYFLGYLQEVNPEASFFSPTFFIGFLLFVLGMSVNLWADNQLIALRKKDQGYKIPEGGLFNYISCPNHFGEMIEWIGFAIIAWNLPALSFAIWTFCNLLPRALNHHRWYKEHFEEYPEERKAVIPCVW